VAGVIQKEQMGIDADNQEIVATIAAVQTKQDTILATLP